MNPVSSVLGIADTLSPILKNLECRELLNCALVNRLFYRCAKPLLRGHALLKESPHFFYLRRLAETLSVEQFQKITGNVFIFERLLSLQPVYPLNGSEWLELESWLESELLPLKSIGGGILSHQQIKAIVEKVINDNNEPYPPSLDKMRQALRRGFSSEIDQLSEYGELTEVKINHLYNKAGILALARGLTSTALQAFAQIEDNDIKLDILALIKRQYINPPLPAEAQHAAEVIEKMVNSGLFVNYPDNAGRTPLHHALSDHACYKREKTLQKIVEDFIRYGANVNWSSNVGQTPAHSAVISKLPEVLQTLINHGANMRKEDENGTTPIDLIKESHSSALYTILTKNNLTSNPLTSNQLDITHII